MTFKLSFVMSERSIDPIVPKQRTGKAIDATGSVILKDEGEAKAFFGVVKNRLQNVNEWVDLAGNLSATFQLVDADGSEVSRNLQQGDHFKIDIPGPGSKTGDGYDWVQIEDVENKSSSDEESFSFRVRPTENPQNQNQDIAHFYSPESTSTFTVSRKGCNVDVAIRDRNTKPNKAADSPVDKIRDSIVGTMGVLSFSKIQWQNLVDGLLTR
jgi:hypothetical protein